MHGTRQQASARLINLVAHPPGRRAARQRAGDDDPVPSARLTQGQGVLVRFQQPGAGAALRRARAELLRPALVLEVIVLQQFLLPTVSRQTNARVPTGNGGLSSVPVRACA